MDSQQLFEDSSYPAKVFPRERPRLGVPSAGNKDASPERALPRPRRRVFCASPDPIGKAARALPQTAKTAPLLCMPRISYTTKDFKSCRINTYKKLGRFSHLAENTQLQVLYNQHLRVFSSQLLYIQHLHKNRGVGGGGYLPSYPSGSPKSGRHPPVASNLNGTLAVPMQDSAPRLPARGAWREWTIVIKRIAP